MLVYCSNYYSLFASCMIARCLCGDLLIQSIGEVYVVIKKLFSED
jgi:hypothetical protein